MPESDETERRGNATTVDESQRLHAAAVAAIADARKRLVARRDPRAPLTPHELALHRLETRLNRPLRVAIAGEFNTGKSSLCNRLLGVDGLPTAALPNTSQPTRIAAASEPMIHLVFKDGRREPLVRGAVPALAGLFRIDVGLPGLRRSGLELLDFPGLGDSRFQRGSGDLLRHRCDMVVWCTAGTQAWKETERAAWSGLPERLRRASIIAITHGDLVPTPEDAVLLTERVRFEILEDNAGVFLVSTQAARAPADAGILALEDALDELAASLRLDRTRRASLMSARIIERAVSGN